MAARARKINMGILSTNRKLPSIHTESVLRRRSVAIAISYEEKGSVSEAVCLIFKFLLKVCQSIAVSIVITQASLKRSCERRLVKMLVIYFHDVRKGVNTVNFITKLKQMYTGISPSVRPSLCQSVYKILATLYRQSLQFCFNCIETLPIH